jgi:hypothetical protein
MCKNHRYQTFRFGSPGPGNTKHRHLLLPDANDRSYVGSIFNLDLGNDEFTDDFDVDVGGQLPKYGTDTCNTKNGLSGGLGQFTTREWEALTVQVSQQVSKFVDELPPFPTEDATGTGTLLAPRSGHLGNQWAMPECKGASPSAGSGSEVSLPLKAYKNVGQETRRCCREVRGMRAK